MGGAAPAGGSRSARLHHSVDQPDFPTATRFINALLETGITVHRATRGFPAQGKTYPAGSYVVIAAQAFRPHVMDMFEPQDHPDNFPYAGAPPTPPYDNAGWTLAYQMGIEFDRIFEGFTGPFETITDWNVKSAGRFRINVCRERSFYLTGPKALDAFVAVNRLLAADQEVYRVADGSFWVTCERRDARVAETGVRRPGHQLLRLHGSASGFERRQTHTTACRPLGPVRRIDKFRLDEVDSRAVRISV